jgi:23S rRNA (adenine2503-C2)-methyltransferase
MKILGRVGTDDLANVYLAETESGKYIEFVESIQPPIPREKKWVLIVSTLFGCPVGCTMCDAGTWYKGKLSENEIFEQIDYLVISRYPDRIIPAEKFKIQFARMGDPSFNKNVLEVLKKLPDRYSATGLLPSISTVAPNGTDYFFDQLIEIKNKYYSGGSFQMQFSIHSTDEKVRDSLIPINKWDFKKIADYGARFFRNGDQKIALNFALEEKSPIEINKLERYFNPDIFIIKLTPVNPTISAIENKLKDGLTKNIDRINSLVQYLKQKYDVIISIGELEENKIGSNCGQYVRNFLNNRTLITEEYQKKTYNYQVVNY